MSHSLLLIALAVSLGGPALAPAGPSACGGHLLRGYHVYPIAGLKMLNANSTPKDAPLSQAYVTSGKCDVVANGSFMIGGTTPAVPVMRNGTLDTQGYGKKLLPEDALKYGGQITTDHRGGVAVLDTGAIVVRRQQGRALGDIQQAFGRQVKEFMGGGALIIEGGSQVSSDDVFHRQAFVTLDHNHVLPEEMGLDAGQFRSTAHTLVGIHGGESCLIISPTKNGRQLQHDLLGAGFRDVVMFDGGNGFYFTDGTTPQGKSTNNSLGLCVQTRPREPQAACPRGMIAKQLGEFTWCRHPPDWTRH